MVTNVFTEKMDLVMNFVLVLFARSSLGAALQAAFKITSPTGKFYRPILLFPKRLGGNKFK